MPRSRTCAAVGGAVVVALAACTGPGAGQSTTTPPTTSSTAPSPTTGATPARPEPTLVVGLGDSVVSGGQCGCTDITTSYAAALTSSGHGPTSAANLGVSGETAPGLAGQLATDPTTRQDLVTAGRVVVIIGANDLVPLVDRWSGPGCDASCYSPAVTAMGAAVDTDVALILATTRASPSDVLVAGYWDVFEDGDVAKARRGSAFLGWSDAVTRAANAAICAAARTRGATCVDLYRPFKGDGDGDDTGLLVDDGDHPNAAGTARIVSALMAARG